METAKDFYLQAKNRTDGDGIPSTELDFLDKDNIKIMEKYLETYKKELLLQSRQVRNYSNVNDVYNAVPKRFIIDFDEIVKENE